MKFEKLGNLKFQTLEKEQLSKIIGGDCKSGSGTRDKGPLSGVKYSTDRVDDKGNIKGWYYGS
jgi:bacteriocin-like protein